MPPLPICHDTNKHIEVWTHNRRSAASIVAKFMCRCPRSRCTCSPTTSATSATFAAKLSPDHGFYRATCEATLARNHLVAPIAAKLSPIDPICAPTCKRTVTSKFGAANSVIANLPSRPISPSTTSRLVSRTVVHLRWATMMPRI